MPSVQKGEKQGHYMARCVPMLIKEKKNHEQAVAQCLNMFKEHWKAHGESNASDYFSENFSWEECQPCQEAQIILDHKNNIFNIDIPNNKF